MADIQTEYAVPDELMDFVRRGVLKVVSENPAEKTVKFDVPKLQSIDDLRHDVFYNVIWIHPDFNDQFCWYYLEKPGDLPNFMVEKEITDNGQEPIDFETLDDLTAWLADLDD